MPTRNGKEIKVTNHDPFVHQVHQFIVNQYPVRWNSIDSLCERFYGEISASNDTKMREIIREIKLSHVFHHIILTGAKGVKVAESQEEVREYRNLELARLDAARCVVERIDYRQQHDEFLRLPIVGRGVPVYQAILKETKSGQIGFDIGGQHG